MTDNMIEAKKDYYHQQQHGITKMGFTFKHSELPEDVKDAELGKRFYVVFVDADVYDESEGNNASSSKGRTADFDSVNRGSNPREAAKPETGIPVTDKSEGEKMRERACILCKDWEFIYYIHDEHLSNLPPPMTTQQVIDYLYECCEIKSRKELVHNVEAQDKFKELDEKFKAWQLENRYADNLSR